MTVLQARFDRAWAPSTGFYGLARCRDEAERAEVLGNLRAVRAHLGCEHLLMLRHVHGVEVVDADALDRFDQEPEADAAVTTRAGVALAVQTADCVPVLLEDGGGRVLGAAHCGWRGSLAGLPGAVVARMRAKGARTLRATIGPSIRQPSYEVDQAFYEAFRAQGAARLFLPAQRPGHWHFDLPGLVAQRLREAGVDEVADTGEDTYLDPARYFSCRRDAHQGILGDRRNLLSAIVRVS